MARKNPTQKTIKRLFAVSGNLCAFEPCGKSLVDTSGALQCQICHIEAANPGGERYNKDQSDEERRAFENLLILCHEHHITTNNVTAYPVPVMKKMKADHEAKFAGMPYTPPASALKAAMQQVVHMGDGDGPRIVVNAGGVVNLGGGKRPPSEEEAEVTVIDEIFQAVITKIKTAPPKEAPAEPSIDLNEKITINFASAQEREAVAEYIRAALLKMNLIEGAFKTLPVETQKDITGHIYHRYSERKLAGMANIKILLELFAEFTPPAKRTDPTYTNLARAFVLFFFDDCTIFEKTAKEKCGGAH